MKGKKAKGDARQDNLSKPTASQTALPAGQELQVPWYKRAWPYVAGTAGVVAWLLLNTPEVLQNMRGTPEEVRRTVAQYQSWLHEDSEWTGTWSASPEGVVDSGDMDLSAVDLEITIWAKGGDIDGTIATKRICQKVPVDYILLRGKVSGDRARVIVWDIVGSKKMVFAELELTRDGEIMTVKPVKGMVDWFPATARIARAPLNEDAEPQPDLTYCDVEQKRRLGI